MDSPSGATAPPAGSVNRINASTAPRDFSVVLATKIATRETTSALLRVFMPKWVDFDGPELWDVYGRVREADVRDLVPALGDSWLFNSAIRILWAVIDLELAVNESDRFFGALISRAA